MNQCKKPPVAVSCAELARQVRENGFCILPDVIPTDEIDRVQRSVLKTAEQFGQHSSFAPSKTISMVGLVNHDQSFVDYLIDKRLTELVTTLLNEHYRVSFTTGLVNYPGNERGQWHADWPFIQTLGARIPAPYPDAVMHLTCVFPLTEFTAETGATLLLPGSHRRPRNPTGEIGVERRAPQEDEVQAIIAAGSVLVIDSRCWHATAANRSDKPRVAFAVRFAPWWLNLEVLRPNSFLRQRMVGQRNQPDDPIPPMARPVYDRLPDQVKPLFQHGIE